MLQVYYGRLISIQAKSLVLLHCHGKLQSFLMEQLRAFHLHDGTVFSSPLIYRTAILSRLRWSFLLDRSGLQVLFRIQPDDRNDDGTRDLRQCIFFLLASI